ncbi:MAG: polyprenyl diphosphate synthase, partial [Schleiferiaceae bacterium]|nr:polyprenyl diphosphate synthase [Schleiferiaceae bacterium]
MNNLPEHIAIIMDGNGRWAKQHGFFTRIKGHERGVLALKAAATGAAELGIKHLTVYAFSSENWSRPQAEVNALMRILVKSIKKELKTLMEKNIRLNAIGNLSALPKDCQDELQEVMNATAGNDHMVLTLALSYG